MNSEAPEGCERAALALHRANDAIESSRSVFESMGTVMGILARIEAEMKQGFATLSGRIRNLETQMRSSQADIDELENSQVKELRAELKEAQDKLRDSIRVRALNDRRWKWTWIGAVVAIVVAVAGGMILRALGVR